MIRILCYGDSNTWGYISGSDHLRYDEKRRWTKLLQSGLGKNFEIIEEGLNSRTLKSEDTRPNKQGKNGYAYLKPCLDTHDRLDTVILMLGTNELKYSFNHTPQDIFNMFLDYVTLINKYKSQIDKSTPKLIVSGIPLVVTTKDFETEKGIYYKAREKSVVLCELLKNYCTNNDIPYIDNTDLSVGADGVHLTQESHEKLSKKLITLIKTLYC